MEIIEINRSQLIAPMDLEIVPFDYKAKQGEFVYPAYIGGEIPVLVRSNTISEEDFDRMCDGI